MILHEKYAWIINSKPGTKCYLANTKLFFAKVVCYRKHNHQAGKRLAFMLLAILLHPYVLHYPVYIHPTAGHRRPFTMRRLGLWFPSETSYASLNCFVGVFLTNEGKPSPKSSW